MNEEKGGGKRGREKKEGERRRGKAKYYTQSLLTALLFIVISIFELY